MTQPAGTYNSQDVGTASPVSATLIPADFAISGSGALLSNYVLPTTASGPGTITPKTLTVVGITASDKVYDGTIGRPPWWDANFGRGDRNGRGKERTRYR